jgi:hypothetical protein
MNQTSSWQFGLIVAYVLPGFIALAGTAPLLPVMATWLHPVAECGLGLGPPVYAVLAATAVGMFLSCFRWLTIDQIHSWTGVRRPAWDDRQLASTLGGFDYLVQNHFRYYEFCGNSLVAVVWAYGLNRWMGTLPFLGTGTDLGMLIVSAVLFTASRDALAKYYNRSGRLLGHIVERETGDTAMFNGNDHGSNTDRISSPARPKSKPQGKPPTPPNRIRKSKRTRTSASDLTRQSLSAVGGNIGASHFDEKRRHPQKRGEVQDSVAHFGELPISNDRI